MNLGGHHSVHSKRKITFTVTLLSTSELCVLPYMPNTMHEVLSQLFSLGCVGRAHLSPVPAPSDQEHFSLALPLPLPRTVLGLELMPAGARPEGHGLAAMPRARAIHSIFHPGTQEHEYSGGLQALAATKIPSQPGPLRSFI